MFEHLKQNVDVESWFCETSYYEGLAFMEIF